MCAHWTVGTSRRALQMLVMAMGFGRLTHSGAQQISEVYDQYLLCCLHLSICSLCVYWAPCRELQEGASFLSNGIWAPYTFRSYDKKFQKSPINICFVVSNLVFAPYKYIELPVGSSRRELHFWAMAFGLLTYSGAMTDNFRSLRPIFALLLAF